MKKLLLAISLFIPGVVLSAPISYVQLSTFSTQTGGFKTSSGTVTGQLVVGASIRWPDGTVQVSSPPVSSGSGSGIVSPGTFTWSNTLGISVSTLTATSSSTLKYAEFGNSTHAQKFKIYHDNLPINGGSGPQVSGAFIVDKALVNSGVSGGFYVLSSTQDPVTFGLTPASGFAMTAPVTGTSGEVLIFASTYSFVLVDANGLRLESPLDLQVDDLTGALVATNASGVFVSTTVNLGASNIGGTLDISAKTNLAVTHPVILTGDTLSLGQVSLSTGVVNILPAANMVSTSAFTTSTQTFSGQNTFLNKVTISTAIAGVTRIEWSDGTVQVSSPGASGGGSGNAVLSATQTWTGQNNWTTTAQSTFTYGLTAGSITVNGAGDGSVVLTISGSTYSVTASSITPTIGHVAAWSGTGTLIDGGAGGGGGTPGGSTGQLQYNDGGSFAGVPRSFVTSSSVTISSVTIVSSGTFTILGPNPVNYINLSLTNTDSTLQFFQSGVNDHRLTLGSTNGLTVNNKIRATGANNVVNTAGSLISAYANGGNLAAPGIVDLWSEGGQPSYVSFNETGVASNGTIGFPAGGGPLIVYTGSETFGSGTERLRISPTGGLIASSSATVLGVGGLAVTQGISASTVSVTDDAYAAGWNGSTLVPTKNAVYDKIETISAGGGGASTLAVTSGTVAGFNTVISSPTGVINFNGSQFFVSAQGSATSYVTLLNNVSLSSFSATQPILYNSATGVISATPISLSTGVINILPAANMVSTAAFTTSTQTFSGQNTFLNKVTISTAVAGVTRIEWADGTVQVSSPAAGGGGGTPGGSTGQLQYNNAGSFDGVPRSFITASSVTLSSITIVSSGTLTIAGPTPANYMQLSLTDTVATYRFFQSGVNDNTMTLGNTNGLSVNNKFTTTGANNTINTAGALVSASANGGNLSAPGIVDLWSATGQPTYVSFNETGIANNGTIGFPAGGGPLIIYTGSETFGSGTERFRISPTGGMIASSSATVLGAGGLRVAYGITAGSGTFTSSATVGGVGVCLQDGTACPASAGGGSGYALEPATVTIRAGAGLTATSITATSSITVTGAGGINATYGIVGGSLTANDLTASLPVQTDANKKLISGPISLSTAVVGSLQAAQEPAHTGDVTNTAGSLAMTAAASQPNIFTVAGTSFTVSGANGLKVSNYTLVGGSISITGAGGESVTYGSTVGSSTVNDLTASLPVQTNSSKKLISGPISLSTAVVGSLQAAQFPALTGDITTTAGALATTAAASQANIFTVAGTSFTVSGANGLKVSNYALVGGSLSVTGAGGASVTYGLSAGSGAFTSSLTLPNGTGPTVDATAECAMDTTDGAIVCYDGATAKVVAHSTYSVTVTISSGTGWNGLSLVVWRAPHDMAATITKIAAETLTAGTTVMFQLDETTFGGTGSAGTDVFSVAFSSAHNQGVTTTSFANASIAAQSSLVFNTSAAGAAGGAPAGVTFTIWYLKERE